MECAVQQGAIRQFSILLPHPLNGQPLVSDVLLSSPCAMIRKETDEDHHGHRIPPSLGEWRPDGRQCHNKCHDHRKRNQPHDTTADRNVETYHHDDRKVPHDAQKFAVAGIVPPHHVRVFAGDHRQMPRGLDPNSEDLPGATECSNAFPRPSDQAAACQAHTKRHNPEYVGKHAEGSDGEIYAARVEPPFIRIALILSLDVPTDLRHSQH
mmetsp:Transcript_91541/g.296331  ORF Transcript_91541/g.296331 Transcript_91541/m.296331 type:complete len:210 (-) Transcript_91541:215-844(-)